MIFLKLPEHDMKKIENFPINSELCERIFLVFVLLLMLTIKMGPVCFCDC